MYGYAQCKTVQEVATLVVDNGNDKYMAFFAGADSTGAVLGLVVLIAPVVAQRLVPCDIFQQSLATVGGASYSVHRQLGGFLRCEQRQVPEVVTQTVETPQLQFLVGFAAYSCCAMLGSTVDTCSCSASEEAFGRIF